MINLAKKNLNDSSMVTTRSIDLSANQDIRRYHEVRNSVEEHLRKYEYIIPDVRKKKFDLLKQILGEKKYQDIQVRLEKNNLSSFGKHSRVSK